jgi:hypothetical protein
MSSGVPIETDGGALVGRPGRQRRWRCEDVFGGALRAVRAWRAAFLPRADLSMGERSGRIEHRGSWRAAAAQAGPDEANVGDALSRAFLAEGLHDPVRGGVGARSAWSQANPAQGAAR